MKSALIKHGFQQESPPEVHPITGEVFEYTIKWYHMHLSDQEKKVKRDQARSRWLRQQDKKVVLAKRGELQLPDKPKLKFIPSLPAADSPEMQKINEAMALIEKDPRRLYSSACRMLTYYENLCTEYNQAGYGLSQRTNVRERRDFWQAEIDRLLIEII